MVKPVSYRQILFPAIVVVSKSTRNLSMTHVVRIGMGLAPNDPYWVQVREAARQRAQESGVTLVSVAVPDGAPDSDDLLGFLEDLDAQELGALIMHGLS